MDDAVSDSGNLSDHHRDDENHRNRKRRRVRPQALPVTASDVASLFKPCSDSKITSRVKGRNQTVSYLVSKSSDEMTIQQAGTTSSSSVDSGLDSVDSGGNDCCPRTSGRSMSSEVVSPARESSVTGRFASSSHEEFYMAAESLSGASSIDDSEDLRRERLKRMRSKSTPPLDCPPPGSCKSKAFVPSSVIRKRLYEGTQFYSNEDREEWISDMLEHNSLLPHKFSETDPEFDLLPSSKASLAEWIDDTPEKPSVAKTYGHSSPEGDTEDKMDSPDAAVNDGEVEGSHIEDDSEDKAGTSSLSNDSDKYLRQRLGLHPLFKMPTEASLTQSDQYLRGRLGLQPLFKTPTEETLRKPSNSDEVEDHKGRLCPLPKERKNSKEVSCENFHGKHGSRFVPSSFLRKYLFEGTEFFSDENRKEWMSDMAAFRYRIPSKYQTGVNACGSSVGGSAVGKASTSQSCTLPLIPDNFLSMLPATEGMSAFSQVAAVGQRGIDQGKEDSEDSIMIDCDLNGKKLADGTEPIREVANVHLQGFPITDDEFNKMDVATFEAESSRDGYSKILSRTGDIYEERGAASSSHDSGAVPSSHDPGAVPSSQEPGAVPSSQEPGAMPSIEEPGAMPSIEEPEAVPSIEPGSLVMNADVSQNAWTIPVLKEEITEVDVGVGSGDFNSVRPGVNEATSSVDEESKFAVFSSAPPINLVPLVCLTVPSYPPQIAPTNLSDPGTNGSTYTEQKPKLDRSCQTAPVGGSSSVDLGSSINLWQRERMKLGISDQEFAKYLLSMYVGTFDAAAATESISRSLRRHSRHSDVTDRKIDEDQTVAMAMSEPEHSDVDEGDPEVEQPGPSEPAELPKGHGPIKRRGRPKGQGRTEKNKPALRGYQNIKNFSKKSPGSTLNKTNNDNIELRRTLRVRLSPIPLDSVGATVKFVAGKCLNVEPKSVVKIEDKDLLEASTRESPAGCRRSSRGIVRASYEHLNISDFVDFTDMLADSVSGVAGEEFVAEGVDETPFSESSPPDLDPDPESPSKYPLIHRSFCVPRPLKSSSSGRFGDVRLRRSLINGNQEVRKVKRFGELKLIKKPMPVLNKCYVRDKLNSWSKNVDYCVRLQEFENFKGIYGQIETFKSFFQGYALKADEACPKTTFETVEAIPLVNETKCFSKRKRGCERWGIGMGKRGRKSKVLHKRRISAGKPKSLGDDSAGKPTTLVDRCAGKLTTVVDNGAGKLTTLVDNGAGKPLTVVDKGAGKSTIVVDNSAGKSVTERGSGCRSDFLPSVVIDYDCDDVVEENFVIVEREDRSSRSDVPEVIDVDLHFTGQSNESQPDPLESRTNSETADVIEISDTEKDKSDVQDERDHMVRKKCAFSHCKNNVKLLIDWQNTHRCPHSVYDKRTKRMVWCEIKDSVIQSSIYMAPGNKKVCSCTPPFYMISFPANFRECFIWCSLVGRRGKFGELWQPELNEDFICSTHFSDLTSENPYPRMNLGLTATSPGRDPGHGNDKIISNQNRVTKKRRKGRKKNFLEQGESDLSRKRNNLKMILLQKELNRRKESFTRASFPAAEQDDVVVEAVEEVGEDAPSEYPPSEPTVIVLS